MTKPRRHGPHLDCGSGNRSRDIITKHLLIGWELGAGMGHAHRMIPIVSAYLARDWKITVAARHIPRVREALSFFLSQDGDRLSIVQAPIFLHRAPIISSPPVSLTDIFVHAGFADARLCRPVIRAWRRLLDEIAPDIVLSDFAPSLNVAARGKCPVLVIGNGWTIPPMRELPTFAGAPEDSTTRDTSEQIIEALWIASDRHWQAPSFCDLLRGDANFVCTLPRLDPYHRYRTGEHYWPVEIPPVKAGQTGSRGAVLVYLPGDHSALPLVEALAENLPWRVHAYVGSVPHLSERRLLFSSKPLNLPALLPSARLAIHHGGLGIANWCLIHGVPQMIFPTDTEKLLIGRGVMETGSGLVVDISVTPNEMREQVERLSHLSLARPDTGGMQTTSDIETLAALLTASESRTSETGDEA